MRYFLDMNLPIYFCFNTGHPLEINAKRFVESKKDNAFLLCDYIKSNNLPKWLKRQDAILFEFNQKVQNQDYELFKGEQASILFPQDKQTVNNLIAKYNLSKEKEVFRDRINRVYGLISFRIKKFIQDYIDEIVIPEKEIDFELKNCLLIYIDIGASRKNDSDAKTLASAIQEHKNRKICIITSDKKHWTKDLFEWAVPTGSELSKKYPSFPEIKYLQNT
jgi:hypothetical protein